MNTTLARLIGGLLLASATTRALASTASAEEPRPVPPAVTAEPAPVAVQEVPPQPPREPTVSRVPGAVPVTPPPVTRAHGSPEAKPAVPMETRAPQVSPVPVGAPDTGGGATAAMTDGGPPVLAGVATAAGLMGLTVAGAGLVARHRRARR